MRDGNFPVAYAYPHKMRATRDLLSRRTKIVRHGAMLKGHIVNTNSQYNLPPTELNLKNISVRQQLRSQFKVLLYNKTLIWIWPFLIVMYFLNAASG